MKKATLFTVAMLMAFIFSSCSDRLLKFYEKQPRDPEIIGRWEDPDVVIEEGDRSEFKGYIFEENGILKHIDLVKKDDQYETEIYSGVEYRFYTKDNFIHMLIVGDGFKASTREIKPTKYRITADTLEIWEGDLHCRYIRVR